jgi:hypothetical protein
MGKAVVKDSSGNTGKTHVPCARYADWCLTRKRTPMMASGPKAASQVGHKGAPDRGFRRTLNDFSSGAQRPAACAAAFARTACE